jgi:hypothetical protein
MIPWRFTYLCWNIPHRRSRTSVQWGNNHHFPDAAAASNLPVKTFRLGRIKAAVWENEGEQQFYSVTFARPYLDDANKYHDTDSFGRDDLPLVAKLADQAHTFIFERLAESKTKQNE